MSTRRRQRSKAQSGASGYQIGPGTVASLAYELFDAEGERVEASEPGAPLELLFGFGDAVPALEHALQGLSQGQAREVTLPPEEAFGPRDPGGFIEVDRSELPAGIAPGDELEAEREDGQGVVPLKVVEVLDDVAVLDTNHPLAGQRVRLRVVVQAIRPATEQEILSATERLAQPASGHGPLLPAERLLRRGRGEDPRGGDEPPPRSNRVA